MPNQEATLMMPEGALKLKGPGLQILRSCDGNHTFQQIVDALYKQYQQANLQKIEQDTATFLEQLQERRALDF